MKTYVETESLCRLGVLVTLNGVLGRGRKSVDLGLVFTLKVVSWNTSLMVHQRTTAANAER